MRLTLNIYPYLSASPTTLAKLLTCKRSLKGQKTICGQTAFSVERKHMTCVSNAARRVQLKLGLLQISTGFICKLNHYSLSSLLPGSVKYRLKGMLLVA